MAGRIRTIKPELLEDEKACALSDAAWRLFVSSFLLADDHGRFRAGGRYLAASVWQDTGRTADAEAARDELAAAGRIRLYVVGSDTYAEIPTWIRHQRIDNASKPRIPQPGGNDYLPLPTVSRRVAASRGESRDLAALPPTSDLRPPTSDLRPPTSDLRPPDLDMDLGGGPGEPIPAPKPKTDRSKTGAKTEPKRPSKTGTRLPPEWAPTESTFAQARTTATMRLDRAEVLACVEAFRDHWTASTEKTAVKLDWDAAFRTWLRRHREYHPELPEPVDEPPRQPKPPGYDERDAARRADALRQATAELGRPPTIDDVAQAIAGLG